MASEGFLRASAWLLVTHSFERAMQPFNDFKHVCGLMNMCIAQCNCRNDEDAKGKPVDAGGGAESSGRMLPIQWPADNRN